MSQRTIAIGDIHGCDVALNALLHLLDLQPDDTLVVLGDVIDRGPGSREATEQLLGLRQRCRLRLLRGNHEQMLLEAPHHPSNLHRWLEAGGWRTLDSYGGHLENIPQQHWDLFAAALPCWENEEAIFVHANLEPHVPLAEQSSEWLHWQQLTGNELPHPSGRTVFCGHTGQRSGLPTVFPGWVALDTLAWTGLYLTAVELGSGMIYQSRQTGETRYGVTLRDLN